MGVAAVARTHPNRITCKVMKTEIKAIAMQVYGYLFLTQRGLPFLIPSYDKCHIRPQDRWVIYALVFAGKKKRHVHFFFCSVVKYAVAK